MRNSGYVFMPYQAPEQSDFERLFEIFSELIVHTSGDVDEALEWLEVLDKEYGLTNENYTMEDFIEDLKKKGYLLNPWMPLCRALMSITSTKISQDR
jgi:hypothetical protein